MNASAAPASNAASALPESLPPSAVTPAPARAPTTSLNARPMRASPPAMRGSHSAARELLPLSASTSGATKAVPR